MLLLYVVTPCYNYVVTLYCYTMLLFFIVALHCYAKLLCCAVLLQYIVMLRSTTLLRYVVNVQCYTTSLLDSVTDICAVLGVIGNEPILSFEHEVVLGGKKLIHSDICTLQAMETAATTAYYLKVLLYWTEINEGN